jgi:hypothetical protein
VSSFGSLDLAIRIVSFSYWRLGTKKTSGGNLVLNSSSGSFQIR